MIVYCIPGTDDTSPTGSVYAGTQKEAFDIAREASKSDLWGNDFPPDGIRGRGREIEVNKLWLRKADKTGVLAFLNHEQFVIKHETIAVFKNGRRKKTT